MTAQPDAPGGTSLKRHPTPSSPGLPENLVRLLDEFETTMYNAGAQKGTQGSFTVALKARAALETGIRAYGERAEERIERQEQCGACAGQGRIPIGEHYVSHDMARAAGEPDMEGASFGVEWGPCPTCNG